MLTKDLLYRGNACMGLGSSIRLSTTLPLAVILQVDMCIFYMERRRGWYRWHMGFLDDEPAHVWITENDMGFCGEAASGSCGVMVTSIWLYYLITSVTMTGMS